MIKKLKEDFDGYKELFISERDKAKSMEADGRKDLLWSRHIDNANYNELVCYATSINIMLKEIMDTLDRDRIDSDADQLKNAITHKIQGHFDRARSFHSGH